MATRDAERGPKRDIQVNDGTRLYAWEVAKACLLPLAASPCWSVGAAAVVILTASPVTLQWMMPLTWGAIGGLLAYRIFGLGDDPYGPKTVMLVAGGGIVVFLGVSLHLTLWQIMAPLPIAMAHDFPITWYVILVLVLATFFGGQRGWTDISPMVKRVLEYRKQHWQDQQPPIHPQPVPEQWIL